MGGGGAPPPPIPVESVAGVVVSFRRWQSGGLVDVNRTHIYELFINSKWAKTATKN